MDIVKDKHPSYGMLQFCRTTGSPRTLFGSSIQHGDTITMYLREGEVSRELNRNIYFGSEKIVKLEMSYSQFAEAITSMNQGFGVPVTIRFIQGKGMIEDCPFVSKNSLRMNLNRIWKARMRKPTTCFKLFQNCLRIKNPLRRKIGRKFCQKSICLKWKSTETGILSIGSLTNRWIRPLWRRRGKLRRSCRIKLIASPIIP